MKLLKEMNNRKNGGQGRERRFCSVYGHSLSNFKLPVRPLRWLIKTDFNTQWVILQGISCLNKLGIKTLLPI